MRHIADYLWMASSFGDVSPNQSLGWCWR